jgi:hypothetical protein
MRGPPSFVEKRKNGSLIQPSPLVVTICGSCGCIQLSHRESVIIRAGREIGQIEPHFRRSRSTPVFHRYVRSPMRTHGVAANQTNRLLQPSDRVRSKRTHDAADVRRTLSPWPASDRRAGIFDPALDGGYRSGGQERPQQPVASG